ncbi:Serine/threonine protein kinase [Entamoeba marina]
MPPLTLPSSKPPQKPRDDDKNKKKVISINDPSYAKDFDPIQTVKDINGTATTICFKVVQRGTNKEFAAKAIRKEPLRGVFKQKLKTEIEIHRSLEHERIVKVRDVFDSGHYFYILMDCCNSDTLRDVLLRRKTLHEAEIAYWMKQVLEGIIYLHDNHIIHRDLKLTNIFIHDMSVKIGDFGLAAYIDNQNKSRMTMCGTPTSMAPEIIAKTGHSYQVDMWAFGIMLYYLKFGSTPFSSTNKDNVYKKIERGDYTFPRNREISDELSALIRTLLQKDTSKRPNAAETMNNFVFFHKGRVPLDLPYEALTRNISVKQLRFSGSQQPSPTPSKGSSTEIINYCLESILKKRKAESRVYIPGNEYNTIIDYLDKSDKYGVIYMHEDATIGALFNDNTTMYYYTDYYIYFARDGSRLDIDRSSIDDQAHDVNKKCRILNGFYRQLSGGNPERKDLKTCMIKKFFNREGFHFFMFEDNSMQIRFIDHKITYFIDPYNMLISVMKNKTEKFTSMIDATRIGTWDSNVDEHLSNLAMVLQELNNKIEGV